METLFLLAFALVAVMQEDEAEDEDSEHHGEGTGVVGEGGRDETLKLGVLEGAHRHLCCAEEMGVPDAIVVHLELEDTVDVWQLEDRGESSILAGQGGAHEWVNADKLQLDIIGREWTPLTIN